MDYNARYYSPTLGRFISPDTIVPEPGSSGGFNRYRYTRNNPLKYVDPSGHQGCAANNQACWDSRWYRAHGYQQDSGGNWVLGGDAQFDDVEILTDVLGENNISLRGGDKWNWEDLKSVGQGVVALSSNKVGGSDQLSELLGSQPVIGGTRITFAREAAPSGICTSNTACAVGSNVTFYDGLFNQFRNNRDFIRATAVHELGHVIDFHSIDSHGLTNSNGAAIVKIGSYSTLIPHTTYVSDYAQTNFTEYFAEVIAIAVYGSRYNPRGRTDIDSRQIQWLTQQLTVSR